MPTYKYQCIKCRTVEEIDMTLEEHDALERPKCSVCNTPLFEILSIISLPETPTFDR